MFFSFLWYVDVGGMGEVLGPLVGVFCGVLLIILIIWLVFYKKKVKKYDEEETPNEIRYDQREKSLAIMSTP